MSLLLLLLRLSLCHSPSSISSLCTRHMHGKVSLMLLSCSVDVLELLKLKYIYPSHIRAEVTDRLMENKVRSGCDL